MSIFRRSIPPDSRLTASDELLLRAALAPGRAAAESLSAWKRACRYVRYDQIDFAATLILPSVYGNLVRYGLDDAWLPQLSALARQHWLQFAPRQRDLIAILTELSRAGVCPIVVGDFALLAGGYVEPTAARPTLTSELVVAPADGPRIRQCLAQLGWRDLARVPPSVAGWRSEVWRGPGNAALSVHYSLLPRPCGVIGFVELAERSDAAQVGGLACRVPAACDLLLQLAIRGCRAPDRARRQLVWIHDALRLLISSRAVDWSQLSSAAQAAHAETPLHEALQILQQRFADLLPADCLAGPGSFLAREKRRPAASPLALIERKLWGEYARSERAAGRFPSAIGRLRYAAWQLRRACGRRAQALKLDG